MVGTAQWWALRGGGVRYLRWVVAGSVGLAVALPVAAALVGYRTTTGDLALQGLVCGAGLGAAQALVLWRKLGRRALVWPALVALAWASGWIVTSSLGVSVDEQWTVFGASGALTATIVTAVLPVMLRRAAAGQSIVQDGTSA